MEVAQPSRERWELYRLLAEPVRLRLLALASEEELAIGELADLLGEAQPNVSRHVAPLRKGGLLSVRKQGTRALVTLAEAAASDAVVQDGLGAGRALCEADGSLARVAQVVAARDASSREYFARAAADQQLDALPTELPAYLTALAPLLPARSFAVDVGTGDGRLLDLLAPLYERVVAVDREDVQLDRARARLAERGYSNVQLLAAEFDSGQLSKLVRQHGGADVVFASRVLHHAPRPGQAVRALGKLLRPGGALVIIDYCAHEDEAMREQQADLWLGFNADELLGFARRAGLEDAVVQAIPRARCGQGLDVKVGWQCLVARRAS